MKCSLSLEARYMRHKLSVDTKHFEELFAIIYDLGNYSLEVLKDVFTATLDSGNVVELYAKNVRISVPYQVLRRILSKLNVDLNIAEDYEYVLIVNCLEEQLNQ